MDWIIKKIQSDKRKTALFANLVKKNDFEWHALKRHCAREILYLSADNDYSPLVACVQLQYAVSVILAIQVARKRYRGSGLANAWRACKKEVGHVLLFHISGKQLHYVRLAHDVGKRARAVFLGPWNIVCHISPGLLCPQMP